MRFVPSVSPVMTPPDTRQVKGLSATHAIKPVYPREQPVSGIEYHAPHKEHEAVQQVEPQQQREMPQEDRRKTCRRIKHQHVLIELRSGIDRRHHNLRGSDVVDHIDEEA